MWFARPDTNFPYTPFLFKFFFYMMHMIPYNRINYLFNRNALVCFACSIVAFNI